MDYIGSHESVNWLFVLVTLSIIQWVLTIIFVSKNYNILGRTIEVEELKSYKNKVSFSNDYYYMYWNIVPIVLYAFFYYIDTSWNTYLTQIIMIGGDKIKEFYIMCFIEFPIQNISYKWIDTIILIIIVSIAYYATFETQIKKQIQYITKTDKVYWWDIRIVQEIFWIRFIFLFFNLILIGFITYLITKTIIFIFLILSSNNIIFNINPFHPDLFGGLRVIMEIFSIILTMYLLSVMLGVIGLLTHKGLDGRFQFIGDLLNIAYLFFGVTLMIVFVYYMDNILMSVNIESYLSPSTFSKFNIDTNMSYLSISEKAEALNNYYKNLLQFNRFPVDLTLFINPAFTLVIPLSISYIIYN